jgi:hypothetical protein
MKGTVVSISARPEPSRSISMEMVVSLVFLLTFPLRIFSPPAAESAGFLALSQALNLYYFI